MKLDKEYLRITVIGLFAVLGIVAYGTLRCKTSKFTDPLTKSFFGEPYDKYLDGWGITHFLLFCLLAYLFSDKLIYIFLLGVAWELIEFSVKDKPFYLSKCKYTLRTNKGTGWWYGRWQDIVMNSLGMLTGYMLRKYIKK